MATYIYKGEEVLVFPTLSVTVKNGDTFEGPDGLEYDGLEVIDGKKSKPSDVKQTETIDPAPTDPVETQEN